MTKSHILKNKRKYSIKLRRLILTLLCALFFCSQLVLAWEQPYLTSAPSRSASIMSRLINFRWRPAAKSVSSKTILKGDLAAAENIIFSPGVDIAKKLTALDTINRAAGKGDKLALKILEGQVCALKEVACNGTTLKANFHSSPTKVVRKQQINKLRLKAGAALTNILEHSQDIGAIKTILEQVEESRSLLKRISSVGIKEAAELLNAADRAIIVWAQQLP